MQLYLLSTGGSAIAYLYVWRCPFQGESCPIIHPTVHYLLDNSSPPQPFGQHDFYYCLPFTHSGPTLTLLFSTFYLPSPSPRHHVQLSFGPLLCKIHPLPTLTTPGPKTHHWPHVQLSFRPPFTHFHHPNSPLGHPLPTFTIPLSFKPSFTNSHHPNSPIGHPLPTLTTPTLL